MAETPADADRSPFRRFPWVQIVFFLACLSMAAWTWMRFSYRWDATPAGLPRLVCDLGWENWQGGYVLLRGYYLPDNENPLNEDGKHFGLVCDEERTAIAVVHYAYTPRKPDASLAGRVCSLADILGPNSPVGSYDTYVDCRASRFHPASVAGLVVGAMGVFVFGLYLRRWVSERRGAA